jgi:hypothetical protein
MALKPVPDERSDAEITDGVVAGDTGAAVRLWVRFWPVALGAAREYVEPAEVPGLAAEALIGTIASIAVGRGPREGVASFVRDAVRELGEDDEPVDPDQTVPVHPDVFASPLMSAAYAGLSQDFQSTLGDGAGEPEPDEALTALQTAYLHLHAATSATAASRQAHEDLAESVRDPHPPAMPAETWVHMSRCAGCTEAFHELAFSSVALDALVGPALLAGARVVAPAPVEVSEAPDAPVEVPEEAVASAVVLPPDEPSPTEPAFMYDEPAATPGETAETPVVPAASAAALTLPAARARAGDETPRAAGRRRRLVVVGTVVVAVAVLASAVVAVAVSSQGNADKTPPGAGSNHSSSTALPTTQPTAPSSSPTVPSPSAPPTSPASPTSSLGAVAPTASPTSAAIVNPPAATATSPAAKPSTKPSTGPSPKPSTRPSPTAKPTTPGATPTATPTAPAPSPKPSCNPLNHLLGFC